MPPEQQSACKTVLTLRGWHAPLLLAGDVAEDRAVALLREHLRWLNIAVTDTRLEPRAAQTKNALWDAVRGFNLGGLYETLPEENADWRSFTLAGALAGSQYRVDTIAAGAFDQPLATLGDTTSQLAMRPRPPIGQGIGGDRYELRARFRANVGPIAWANVPRSAWMGLDHLTTTAPLPTPTGGGFFGGTGSDAEILLQLEPAFSHLFRWYLGIAEIPDVLGADTTRSPAQHLHLVLQPDDGLRQRYPEVANYLEQVRGFVSAQVAIENEDGRWLHVDLDSVEQRLRIDAWVRDGHLVPSRNGQPRLDAVDADTSLARLSYRSVVDLQLKALGVRMDLSDWPIEWVYRATGTGSAYAGRITALPKIEAGGAALGFIPTGLVDLVIPNNIEGIVEDFMQVLVQSNDGAGAALDITFANDTNNGSILSMSADGDTLDNFFVQFAVSLVNKRIIPDHDQFEGLKRLASDALSAIQADTDTLVAAQEQAGAAGLRELVDECRGGAG